MTCMPRVSPENKTLTVSPKERFNLSSYLSMQFMEPLGSTDGSVEAAWNFRKMCWRQDFVDVTKELMPTLIRWPGGCLSSYYRWNEAIGPRNKRKPMYNILWGGMETNQIGTHEFINLCRLIGADPLIAVNFESDGRKPWASFRGQIRSAGPKEAAKWIDYCNNPSNNERERNGAKQPFGVRLWQIGNETSYDANGYDCETAAHRTLAFARTMRKADPNIKLIGWGDSGWARRMLEIAGEELDYIAFHHHFGSGLDDDPLQWTNYRKDPARTWECLINAYKSTENKIKEMRIAIAGYDIKLALTESHFSLLGRNRGEVLSTWAAGVAEARILNVHERNGDILEVATLADFCGNRWMVNAIMLPTPPGKLKAYMMPVARVMALRRKHIRKKSIGITACPKDLDVTASRTGDRIYLHVVNTNRLHSVPVQLRIEGRRIVSGVVCQIVADPELEIDEHSADIISPSTHILPEDRKWEFPAASVSAVELLSKKKGEVVQ